MLNRNFGNYRTERLLGEGGLGAVYLATDTTQGRKVAIKFFHANLANNPQFQQRFAQEAQVMASLDHANIVRILNYSVQPGQLYLVMDYIAGPNLAESVRSQARDQRTAGPQEAMRLAQQMSDGLDYAHRQNIWHLDLKPSNVLLRPMGDARNRSFLPLISDFGAYRLASSIPGSAAGLLKGNLAYLSPEQLRGERADARADLYTLGIMLYELTTGRPPFQPRSLNEAIQMHTREPAVPPSQVRPGVPRELEQIILRSLAKSPNDRFQSAGEMGRALNEVRTGAARGLMSAPPTAAPAANYIRTQAETGVPAGEMPQYSEFPASQSDVGRARVIFSRQGQPPSMAWIDKDVMNVGRDHDQDIVLDSVQVSRGHARIDKGYDGRYRIMDLGSTNGVWLGNSRIPPNVPQQWQSGQTVRIGDFWLKLEVVTTAVVGQPGQVAGFKSTPPAVIPARGIAESTTTRLDVVLIPNSFSVVPGSPTAVSVEVHNQSDEADRFGMEVRGIPPEWVTLPTTKELRLPPKEKDKFQLAFHPPRKSSSAAGTHDFDVRIYRLQAPDEYVARPGKVQIEPFFAATTDLHPKRLRTDGSTEVYITNTGNAQDTYNVSADDSEQALDIRVDQPQVTVAAGEAGQVYVRARVKARPIIGTNKEYPFRVTVKSARPGGETQTQTAQLVTSPLLPYWLLGALGLTSTACIIAALMALLAGVLSPGGLGGLFGGGGAETTQDVLPGTVIVPGADSDGDTLSDADEIRSYGTDPNKVDTDNDSLNDNVEVSGGTNPTNPDTDGDGIPDGTDPNPRATSTPTVDVLATQTAAQGSIGATDAAVTQTAAQATLLAAQATGTQSVLGPTQTAQASPLVSVSDATTTEGNVANSTVLIFTVTLSRANPGPNPITVNFTINPGTALSGTDFTGSTPGSPLTFAQGESTKTITVNVVSDTLAETPTPKTLTVQLSGPTGAILAKATGIGTIIDDDVPLGLPALSLNDPSAPEGTTTGCGGSPLGIDLPFVVSVSPATHPALTVNFQTLEGSATLADNDYVTNSGTLNIPANGNGTINVHVRCDSNAESTETFTVVLSNPTGGVITKGTGVGTIQNDDAPIVLSINDPAIAEGTTGSPCSGGSPSIHGLDFIVSVSPATHPAISVNFQTLDGSATVADADYVAQSNTLNILPNSNGTITIQVQCDAAVESDQTFSVVLSNPSVGVAISKATGVGTIQNDDAPPPTAVPVLPVLNIADATVSENTGTVTFNVTLTPANPGPGNITVQFATVNGSAVSPGDYTTQSGMLLFGSGDNSQSITIAITNDGAPEPSESFSVVLSSPVGATLGDATGLVTIIDTDPVITISISDPSVVEGDANGTVTLVFVVSLTATNPGPGTITVNYATVDDVAPPAGADGTEVGADYASQSGTLTFDPGDTSKTITIQIVSDDCPHISVNTSETFRVNLSGPVGASLAESFGRGTIVDDLDLAPCVD